MDAVHFAIPARTEKVHVISIRALPDHWSQLQRHVFFLADGNRDTARIASLLTTCHSDVLNAIDSLVQEGYLRIADVRTVECSASAMTESLSLLRDKDEFARTIYRLFYDMLPETKQVFKTMSEKNQRSMLIVTIGMLVHTAKLEMNENDASLHHQLTFKHSNRGILAADYDKLTIALIAAFRIHLRSKWTQAMEESWMAICMHAKSTVL